MQQSVARGSFFGLVLALGLSGSASANRSQSYRGFGGSFYDKYPLTFSGLNFSFAANTLYGFALAADPKMGIRSHCTPPTQRLSGTPHQAADNLFRGCDATTARIWAPPTREMRPHAVLAGTKAAISMLQIWGTLVPEPASLGLMTLGIGALILIARKRA